MSEDRRSPLLSERASIVHQLSSLNIQRAALIARLSVIDSELQGIRLAQPVNPPGRPKKQEQKQEDQTDPFARATEDANELFFYRDTITSDGFQIRKDTETQTIVIEGYSPGRSPGHELTTFRVDGTGIQMKAIEINHPPKKSATKPVHLKHVLGSEQFSTFSLPFNAREDAHIKPLLTRFGEVNLGIFRRPSGDVEIQMISATRANDVVRVTIPAERTAGLVQTQ